MARHLSCGPLLLEHLIRTSMLEMGLDALAACVHQLDGASLAVIRRLLSASHLYPGLARAYRMERAGAFQVSERLKQGDPSQFGQMEEVRLLFKLGPVGTVVFTRLQIRHLQFMAWVIEAAEREPWEVARGRATAEYARWVATESHPSLKLVQWEYIIAGLLAKTYETTVTARTDLLEARRRAACCALSLWLHRQEGGVDPAHPAAYCRESLGGILVRDPFTGDDLKFELSPAHIRVFSVGPVITHDAGDSRRPDAQPSFSIGAQ